MQARRHLPGWIIAALLTLLAVTVDPIGPIAAIPLLCVMPGVFVLRLIGIDYRGDRLGAWVLAIGLSLALSPLVLDPLWHFSNSPRWITGVFGGLIVALGAFADYLRRGAVAPPPGSAAFMFQSAPRRVAVGTAAALVAFVTIGTYWPDQAGGSPVPSQIHDYIKHHAVLSSLQWRPLPLGNPFFADQAGGPCYYYHFFYLIPATVRGGWMSIGLAFGVQAALVALATAGLCARLARRLSGSSICAAWAFILSTVIGGIDIVPLLIQHKPAITLDAWADTLVRIHSLLTQMVWTPQNVQGVMIALLGANLLSEKAWWRGWLWLGPMLAASLAGSSVWVGCAVAPGLVLWALVELRATRRDRRALAFRLLGLLTVAATTIALASPNLLGYAEMSRRLGKSLTTDWPVHQLNASLLGRFVPPGILANLVDLPWILVIEFGALLVFPLLLRRDQWRAAWRDPGVRLLMLSSITALAGFVTVRSHFTYNDFGQKVVMIAMATGAIIGSCVFVSRVGQVEALRELPENASRSHSSRGAGPRKLLIATFLILGLPVALFQSPIAAIRRFLSDTGPLHIFAYAPAVRARQEAQLLRYLRDQLPPDAVVQADWGEERLDLQQLINRQIGVTILEQDTHVFTGRDPSLQEQALDEVAAVLGQPCEPVECHAVLRRHGITHLLVGQVERQKWRGLEKLEAPAHFECVLRSGDLAVYRLR